MASNVLTDVVPKLLAMGLQSLRNMCVMPGLVNSDYSSMAARKGSTIDVVVPTATVAAKDVVPGVTPPAASSTGASTVPIALNNWKYQDFELGDKEFAEIEDGVIPMAASSAVSSLADAVNAQILGNYKGIYGHYGTAGTTPFATKTTAAAQAGRVLDSQKCPPRDRRMVLDTWAHANAVDLQAFQAVNWSGESITMKDAVIGQKMGFTWARDQQIPTHTAGTLADGTINGTPAAGVTTINVASTAGGTLTEGDLFTIAGHTTQYVVKADVTIGATSNADVTIAPALSVTLAGSEALTVIGDHTVNLAFHRDAIAFATRPLIQNKVDMVEHSMTMQDDVSGLIMRLELKRGHYQTMWAYDILWGSALIRPELAARVLG